MSGNISIITCRKCGEKLESTWSACPNCGTPTGSPGLLCPNRSCQRPIKKHWKICPYCETTLSGCETPHANEDFSGSHECRTKTCNVPAWWNQFSNKSKSIGIIITFLLLVVVVGAAILIGIQQSKRRSEMLVDISNAAATQAARNWKQAAILYEKLLAKKPDNLSFENSLAVCQYMEKAENAERQDRFDEALIHCQNARDFATVPAIIGVIETKIKNISNKKERFDKITALLAKAQTLKSKGEFDKSIGCITELLALDAGNAKAQQLHAELSLLIEQEKFRKFVARAVNYKAQSDWGKAIEAYSQAMTIKPDDMDIKSKLAECHHHLNVSKAKEAENEDDLENAIEFYTKALSYKQIESTQIRLDSAKKTLLAKMELQRKQQEYDQWIKKAENSEHRGDLSSAIKFYAKAQEYTNDSLQDKMSSLSQQLAQQQNQEKSRQLVEQARAHLDKSALDEAFTVVRQALVLFPGQIEAITLESKIKEKIAEKYEKMAVRAEAREDFLEAIQLYRKAQEYGGKSLPNKIRSLNLRAAEQEKQQKFDKLLAYAKSKDSKPTGKNALNALEQALDLYPNNREALRLKEKIRGYYIMPWAKAPFGETMAKKLQQQASAYFDVPVEKTIYLGNGIKMVFVLIPGGEFNMGGSCFGSRPVHRVKISKPFYMGKFEVTQAQFESVMSMTIRQARDKFVHLFKLAIKGEGPNYPMYFVTRKEANEFCSRLSQRKKNKFRLPTEAEWEYACRAGTQTLFYWGDNTHNSQMGKYAWYKANSDKRTHIVGQKKLNPFGLYDIIGNVSEWCHDYYDDSYYSYSPASDPQGPLSSGQCILRGGDWTKDPLNCESNVRRGIWENYRCYDAGFRIVMELDN
ncbi:MAG: SUMF1/EgtB/PvdO family nonheme iron enzyme [Planctomycetota bacterium]